MKMRIFLRSQATKERAVMSFDPSRVNCNNQALTEDVVEKGQELAFWIAKNLRAEKREQNLMGSNKDESLESI